VISDSDKRKILSAYLGNYSIPIPSTSTEELRKNFPKRETHLVQGTPHSLKTIGCYFLLEFGQVRYRSIFSYEIVEVFLGNMEEDRTFCDDQTPFLIIYHTRSTMQNRQLEPMIIHTVGQRQRMNRPTLVLTESRIKEVETFFRSSNLKVDVTFSIKETFQDVIEDI